MGILLFKALYPAPHAVSQVACACTAFQSWYPGICRMRMCPKTRRLRNLISGKDVQSMCFLVQGIALFRRVRKARLPPMLLQWHWHCSSALAYGSSVRPRLSNILLCVCVCVIHKESMQQSIYTLKIIKDICQLLPFQAVHVVLYPRNTDLFEIELVQSRKTCPAASESVSVYVPTTVDHSDHSNNSD